MYRNEPDDTFVKAVDLHVEVLNYALRDVPADRVRLHLCWGNYEGPHHCDIDLEKIVQGFLKAKPSILLFEAANPRHEHEWSVWRDARIPEDKILVPGVLSSTTNYIEHPRLVAERLGRFVDFAGADRVMAGTDCGFGTWAGFGVVDPDICWAKFRSLAEGAAMASDRAKAA
jgi:5-methyltetrahydropteroyltriglutamate--homocysteine methyltransferase